MTDKKRFLFFVVLFQFTFFFFQILGLKYLKKYN